MQNVRISTLQSSCYKIKPTEKFKPMEELHSVLYNQADKIIDMNDSLQPDMVDGDI